MELSSVTVHESGVARLATLLERPVPTMSWPDRVPGHRSQRNPCIGCAAAAPSGEHPGRGHVEAWRASHLVPGSVATRR